MENLQNKQSLQNFIRILKGSITAIILTLLLLFVFALILTYTNLPENISSAVIIIITAISIFIGSSISTLKIKKNGIINGALVGLIYILTIYVISSITGTTFRLNLQSIIMIISSIIGGIIGGIIGVNLK